jgi:Coenzyme PQQ synthesis protein D (PqqD)
VSEPLRLRNSAIEWREIDGEVVALDLERSVYVAVNRSGAVLWPALVEGAEREHLVEMLEQEFAIDRDAAERDVDEFIGALRKQALLEPDASE